MGPPIKIWASQNVNDRIVLNPSEFYFHKGIYIKKKEKRSKNISHEKIEHMINNA